MRLISWNIDHPAKSNDIEAVIRTLRSANPDVVALQEVTRRIPQGFLEGLSRLGLEYKQAYMHIPTQSGHHSEAKPATVPT
jgi:endonuclease/exonuclease/phosphatase family metal-dependent hydrolase